MAVDVLLPIFIFSVDEDIHPVWYIHSSLNNIPLVVDVCQSLHEGLQQRSLVGVRTIANMPGTCAANVENIHAGWIGGIGRLQAVFRNASVGNATRAYLPTSRGSGHTSGGVFSLCGGEGLFIGEERRHSAAVYNFSFESVPCQSVQYLRSFDGEGEEETSR